MQKISRIMCVVDPDADAQPALQRGAWLANNLGAELELLICYYNEYLSDGRLEEYPALENAHEDILDGLKMLLESMASPLRDSGMVVNTKSAWDHPRYEGIESQQFAKCNAEVLCIFCENVTGSGHQKFSIRRKMYFLRTSTVNNDFNIHYLQISAIKTAATHARDIFASRALWFTRERELDQLVVRKIRVQRKIE